MPEHLPLPYFLIVIALLTATSTPHAETTQGMTSIPIFHVGKNTNRNQVHFAANITADCTFVEHQPVSVFWRRLEEGPDVTRELRWAEEKFAYGVAYAKQTSDHVIFTVVADETRPIDLKLSRFADICRLHAETTLLNKRVRPDHVFTEIKPRRLLFPKIIHVDLKGIAKDGSTVCERVQSAGEQGQPCLIAEFQLPPTTGTLLK